GEKLLEPLDLRGQLAHLSSGIVGRRRGPSEPAVIALLGEPVAAATVAHREALGSIPSDRLENGLNLRRRAMLGHDFPSLGSRDLSRPLSFMVDQFLGSRPGNWPTSRCRLFSRRATWREGVQRGSLLPPFAPTWSRRNRSSSITGYSTVFLFP